MDWNLQTVSLPVPVEQLSRSRMDWNLRIQYLRPYQLVWYRLRRGWNLQDQYLLPCQLRWYRSRMDWNLQTHYLARTSCSGIDREWIGISNPISLPVPVGVGIDRRRGWNLRTQYHLPYQLVWYRSRMG